jgi:predicted ATPase
LKRGANTCAAMPAGDVQGQLPLGDAARPEFCGGGYLTALRLRRESVPDFDRYPFHLPAVRTLHRLELHPAVTFFIGENGSGKSTLLEALAVKLRFNPEGGSRDHMVNTRPTHSPLHEHLTLERRGHFADGWFLRAESFYNVASEVEMAEEEFGRQSSGPPYRAYGGKSLHAQSHGESFLALLTNRLQGGGVYLFDEPEAALSPQRQLSVLTLLHRFVYHRSQLVIATHSPLLLAYPHARIYEFDERGIRETRYEDTDHFRLTRDFLNRPARMLELLLREEEAHLQSLRR